ncbi:MAG: ornithine cyclodeaminase family protein, partial [Bacteroidetes bacterium]
METIELKDIQRILPKLDLLKAMEDGFANYSKGLVRVPPVAEMLFEKGEVHIKYGYVDGGRNYVIKVASGFYSNQELGLPTSNGLMLLFSQ